MNRKVSVIIPTRNAEDTIEDCLKSLQSNKELDEIIIVDDSTDKTKEIVSKYPVKLIETQGIIPSEKCNRGIEYSSGDILGFTDQDCVVPSDWVNIACDSMAKTGAHVVGGPNLTPKDAGYRQECAGQILSSWFGAGPSVFRYKAIYTGGEVTEVDESKLTSSNFFFNKKALIDAGKFDPRFYSCEENELLYRMKRAGFKLCYVPNLIVWHYRRPVIKPLMKEILWYANGRGVFLRLYPKSFKIFNILPSVFFLGLLLGPAISLLYPILKTAYLATLCLYFVLNLLSSVNIALTMRKGLKVIPLLVTSYFLVHLSYGIGLLYGLSGRWRRYKRQIK